MSARSLKLAQWVTLDPQDSKVRWVPAGLQVPLDHQGPQDSAWAGHKELLVHQGLQEYLGERVDLVCPGFLELLDHLELSGCLLCL